MVLPLKIIWACTKGTLDSVLAIIMALPAPDETVWWKLAKGIIL
jgi:hypothetical protein